MPRAYARCEATLAIMKVSLRSSGGLSSTALSERASVKDLKSAFIRCHPTYKLVNAIST